MTRRWGPLLEGQPHGRLYVLWAMAVVVVCIGIGLLTEPAAVVRWTAVGLAVWILALSARRLLAHVLVEPGVVEVHTGPFGEVVRVDRVDILAVTAMERYKGRIRCPALVLKDAVVPLGPLAGPRVFDGTGRSSRTTRVANELADVLGVPLVGPAAVPQLMGISQPARDGATHEFLYRMGLGSRERATVKPMAGVLVVGILLAVIGLSQAVPWARGDTTGPDMDRVGRVPPGANVVLAANRSYGIWDPSLLADASLVEVVVHGPDGARLPIEELGPQPTDGRFGETDVFGHDVVILRTRAAGQHRIEGRVALGRFGEPTESELWVGDVPGRSPVSLPPYAFPVAGSGLVMITWWLASGRARGARR